MILRTFFTAFFCLLLNVSLFGQSIPEPEFALRPYILGSNNELTSLERADAKVEIKVKGMGYGGSESYFTVFTPKSEVRASKEKLPMFIIKINDDIDPSEVVYLSKAKVKKDRRRFLQGSMALGGKARDVSQSYVNLEFKKVKSGIYEIILPKDLEVGEYAFMPINEGTSISSLTSRVKISCFGID